MKGLSNEKENLSDCLLYCVNVWRYVKQTTMFFNSRIVGSFFFLLSNSRYNMDRVTGLIYKSVNKKSKEEAGFIVTR